MTRAALALLLAGLAGGAGAQSAEAIVDRYIEAAGGAEALRSVRSLRLSGTVAGGGEFLWLAKAPSAYYLELRQGGAHAVEAFNGKSAWRKDEAGLRSLTGNAQAAARATGVHRNGRFVTYKKDKTRLRVLGRELVEGRAAHAVLVTTASGLQRKVWFDAATKLVLKEEQPRDGGVEQILFFDYRSVGGVQEPGRLRLRRNGRTLDLAVHQAAHNDGVDPAAFDFPASSGAPFPDFEKLFKDVLGNQQRLERAREDYTYTKTETDIAVDGTGVVTEKPPRTYEVYHVAGKEIDKLVAVGGRPLPAAEAAREQARVEKAVREQRRRERGGAERAAEEGDREELTVSQLLRACRFVNPRRERFRGREVLVYDFEPRPGEKARSRVESWMRKLTGNVWIDEQARGIVRAEARANESIRMAGGLLFSVQPGASFVFEQELVNGEVFLPSYAELSASARLLLVKGFKINQRQRFSDYRKFGVETSAEIKPPRP